MDIPRAKPLQWWDYNRDHPIADAFFALYALDEVMGPDAFDKVNDHTGVLTNSPTRAGEGISFAGTSHILLPDAVGDAIENAGSLFAWWDHNGDTSAAELFDSRASDGDGWDFAIGDDSEIAFDHFGLVVDTGVTKVAETDITTLSNGPHCVVGTYDGANVRLYLDGVLKDTTAQTGAASRTANPKIGNQANNAKPFTAGPIMLFGIAKRALSLSEIEELCARPWLLIEPPSTKVYFLFQEPGPAPSGPSAGVLHRGNLPGVLSRVA